MTDHLVEILGTYRGHEYLLRVRVEPSFDAPEEFAGVVYHRDPDAGENVEIARIDTAHGFTHFDRLYRRDQPKERVDWGLWEAVRRLRENWRTYAESFEKREG
jgi:hypothetical protein